MANNEPHSPLRITDKPVERLQAGFDSHAFGVELHEFGERFQQADSKEEVDRLIGTYSKRISLEFLHKKTHSDIASKLTTTFCFLLILAPCLVVLKKVLSLSKYEYGFYFLVLSLAALVVSFALPGNQQNFKTLARSITSLVRSLRGTADKESGSIKDSSRPANPTKPKAADKKRKSQRNHS